MRAVIKKLYLFLIPIFIFGVVQYAVAQGSRPCTGSDAGRCFSITNPLGSDTLPEIIAGLISQFTIYIGAPLVAIMVMFGAYQMLFSGGSEERYKQGKKTILYTVIGYAVLLISTGVGSLVMGVLTGSTTPGTGSPVTTPSDFYDIAVRILSFMQTFFWILASIFIVVAAYKYLTSAGSEDKVKSAKMTLIYAGIAIVVALISTAVVGAINSFLGG